MALRKLLDKQQREYLAAERELFSKLIGALMRAEILPEDLERLHESVVRLEELFLLVVVGEFNSGKSAFINALLGRRFLEEGVTPTTHEVHLLRYGAEIERETKGATLIHVYLPVPLLEEINIVDTPGTNAVIRQHEHITQEFVPRSDLVLFVTSADRPFTESERLFLERIRQWGKKVMIVINKIDIIEGDDAIDQVVTYIRDNSQRLLGFTPEIFPVSSKLALQAKTAEDKTAAAETWRHSRFEPLERYITETLDEQSRIRLKLLSPLGVAEETLKRYQASVAERLALLAQDVTTMQHIDSQLEVYRHDMLGDFAYRVTQIENKLLAMETRGLNFFDETIRMGRIFDLINSERIRGAFEREVVADTGQEIEKAVHEAIDWFVDHDLRQWKAVMEYLNKRRLPEHEERIIGHIDTPFETNRRALLDSVGKAAQEAVATYDKGAEARAIGEATQLAVAQAALLEAGAVGLGTLVTIALSSTVADFTGILAAGLLATLGFFVIPSKRRRAKSDLQMKLKEVRNRLVTGLNTQFEQELERSLRRIREAIAPYTRFVRAEGERLKRVQTELAEIQEDLSLLRARIERQ